MMKRQGQVSMLFVNTYFNSQNIEFTAYHGLILALSLHKVQNIDEWIVGYKQTYLTTCG